MNRHPLQVVYGALHVAMLWLSCATAEGQSAAVTPPSATQPTVRVRSVQMIWNGAPHNAFTDLIRWNERWYCAFREGLKHADDRGKLRIIASDDGEAWRSVALLEHPEFDLRDAALSITPDNRLMIMGGAQKVVEGRRVTGTVVSFCTDGVNYSAPQMVLEPARWLWRLTWHQGVGYGVAYGPNSTSDATRSALLQTRDGTHYSEIVRPLLDQGEKTTEARVRFTDQGTMYCLHRRDGKPNTAVWGVSQPPYKEWAWHDMEEYLGGPNFLQIPSGQWIAVGRSQRGKAVTSVSQIDVSTGKLTELVTLPSGGDTSYPGLVWHGDRLWISYYSSHEGNARIYLAQLDFAPSNNVAANVARPADAAVIDVGHHWQPLWDDYLVESQEQVELQLQRPVDAGVVLKFDRPWEGLFCGYATIIHDGARYLAYYRGCPEAGHDGDAGEVTCYAESSDGMEWKKPELGLFAWNGSQQNNIILADAEPVTHNFSPFLDARPDVPADQRFKALGGTATSGLIGYQSGDGIHWRRIQDTPLFHDTGWVFDSQNVCFWSTAEQKYLLYYRRSPDGVRAIARAESADFLHWSPPVQMTYSDTGAGKPSHDLYTNQTHPYFRSPHVYVSTAARFFPGRRVLSDAEADAIRVHPKYFQDTSDAVLMTSHPGESVYRRPLLTALIRPGIGPQNWVSRTNYPALNVVPTAPHEMSLYVNQDYGQPTSHLRRYVFRTDGLACLHAPYHGGSFTTRPLRFEGQHLVLNFATSAAGGIVVEILDEQGRPIPGFSREQAQEIIGNEIERRVRWENHDQVNRLAGQVVRLKFYMHDADLFAFRFQP